MERLNTITLNFSVTLARLRLAVFVLSLLAIASCGLDLWIKLALLLMVAGHYVTAYHQSRREVVQGLGFEQGDWFIIKNNEKRFVELFGQQLVLPYFVMLNLQDKNNGKKYYLPLLFDAVDEGGLRRLRIFLRYQ